MPKPVSRSMRRTVVVAIALLAGGATALPVAQARPAAATGPVSVRQDFNGDGYEDLAVAAPYATVSGKANAGYVAVLHGSASGLNPSVRKVYSQATTGVPGVPEGGDRFGHSLAAADLDGDGYTDLVVEAKREFWQRDGIDREGNRTVLWGGPSGLGSGTVLPPADDGRYQGEVTVTGDFDGDGRPDLAQKSRAEFGPFTRDGRPASVQDDAELVGADLRMAEVSAGDVDGDGITDLVTRSVGGRDEQGEYVFRLHYVRGGGDGLAAPVTLEDAQGRFVDPLDSSLELGDLNGDGRADLVLGRNSLTVFNGTADGPGTAAAPRVIDQDTPGVPGTQETVDSLGRALAIGDVDGDGFGDVLAGLPGENLASMGFLGNSVGSVVVVPGGPDGPTGAGARGFHQNSADVPGTAEKGDGFGGSVHLVDGNGDGRAEPVAAAYPENDYAGAVWVFRSTSTGVTAKGSFVFGARALGTVAPEGWLGYAFPTD
ncbi:FG-GAP repeat domain-containing protein [Streptomyces sp. NPDC003635]